MCFATTMGHFEWCPLSPRGVYGCWLASMSPTEPEKSSPLTRLSPGRTLGLFCSFFLVLVFQKDEIHICVSGIRMNLEPGAKSRGNPGTWESNIFTVGFSVFENTCGSSWGPTWRWKDTKNLHLCCFFVFWVLKLKQILEQFLNKILSVSSTCIHCPGLLCYPSCALGELLPPPPPGGHTFAVLEPWRTRGCVTLYGHFQGPGLGCLWAQRADEGNGQTTFPFSFPCAKQQQQQQKQAAKI